ncbi:MAG: GNAT family N-acetyltransferase [Elusimicrobia bacterium]|nr:GNAT family N-acetyltransferase [Elusimicrobiota bacterium]
MTARALVPTRERDLASYRRWRNAQQDFLRQEKPLRASDQLRWFRETVLPSRFDKKPALAMFSILEDERCVGYAGLTHICWPHNRAEVVFLVATERLKDRKRYAADFRWALELLKSYAFDHLGLERLTMENHDLRPWHIKALERAGFKPEGRLRGHVVKKGRRLDLLIHGLLAREAGR